MLFEPTVSRSWRITEYGVAGGVLPKNANGQMMPGNRDVLCFACRLKRVVLAADDIVLLSFEQSMELTIRDLYDVALNLGSFTGAQLETVNAIRDAHEAYGNSISGLLGRNAPNAALPKLFTALKADFAGNAQDVATAARTLENNAAATHIETLDALVGIDGAALIASIIIVEARHATVLASFAGVSALDDLLASDGKALSPSDYTTK